MGMKLDRSTAVVPSEELGESAAAIAGSDTRGQVLHYDSPQQFAGALAR
jgi:hypothetical protein